MTVGIKERLAVRAVIEEKGLIVAALAEVTAQKRQNAVFGSISAASTPPMSEKRTKPRYCSSSPFSCRTARSKGWYVSSERRCSSGFPSR